MLGRRGVVRLGAETIVVPIGCHLIEDAAFWTFEARRHPSRQEHPLGLPVSDLLFWDRHSVVIAFDWRLRALLELVERDAFTAVVAPELHPSEAVLERVPDLIVRGEPIARVVPAAEEAGP